MKTSSRTVRAAHYRTGRISEIIIRDGQVVAIHPSRGSTPLVYGPGLFDIQVNGFAGIDFLNASITPERFRYAVHRLWQHGTTHFLPTICTGPTQQLFRGLRCVVDACRQFPELRPSVMGIHLEGPYISRVEGARGAHPLRFIVRPNPVQFGRLQKAAEGMIRMVTLATEVDGGLRLARTLSRRGIVVALGHTNATPEEIAEGVAAGARISTHLGNGAAQVLPRHRNYIFAQLADDRLFASFIADGHHLPPYVLKSFLRAKPRDRSILTTDCVSPAGAPNGNYTVGDINVKVGRDRVVREPGTPYLAGSALTMDDGISNAVRMAGVSLADAWDMSSSTPWQLMRSASLSRRPSLAQCFVVARPSQKHFAIQLTVINRHVVYCHR
jgi:N-acetylglucosamine-6-phosphate deacetylase